MSAASNGMDAVQLFNSTQNLKKLPEIRPGFTVRVHQKIKEGEKSRIQIFEGLVIARKHGSGPNSTITVRKTTSGIGVERIFPLHSPNIEKFEVVKIAKTRRAKLYYIRNKAAKEIRKKMKTAQFQEKLKEIQEKQVQAEKAKAESETKTSSEVKAADDKDEKTSEIPPQKNKEKEPEISSSSEKPIEEP